MVQAIDDEIEIVIQEFRQRAKALKTRFERVLQLQELLIRSHTRIATLEAEQRLWMSMEGFRSPQCEPNVLAICLSMNLEQQVSSLVNMSTSIRNIASISPASLPWGYHDPDCKRVQQARPTARSDFLQLESIQRRVDVDHYKNGNNAIVRQRF